ncbi:MAG: ankyrin repeat domain-containing protein [Proteobacteria bacterium]|nr:ankyrin repeat domain-containing protein [Pseudomonadota bacterium]
MARRTRPAGREARGGRRLAAALALGLGASACLTAAPARAQMAGAGGTQISNPLPASGNRNRGPVVKPPPAALPGARGSEAVAPAPIDSAGMDPTAALFDAINRDDLAAARDALNRGAALQGDNVLGMTPLQLSIDLGRNDITFLLLSMGAGNAAASGGGGAPPRAVAGGRGAGPRPVATPAAATVRTHPARGPVTARRAAPVSGPERFAGNGGTPVPSAGFLGFDPTR